MSLFWTLTGLMTLLALAFVLPPLWRRAPTDAAGADDARRLHALEQAHAAGVLSDDEYAAKRTALSTVEPAPIDGTRPWVAAALLALTIPLGAWLMYRELGEPAALDASLVAGAGTMTADGAPPPSMDQAVAGLAERLRNEPDNLEGWLLLGRAYKSMERFDAGREALANAYRLAPQNPDVMIEYAEALALATPERRFDGESLELLQRATAQMPDHQRGLWLLGIAAMQAGDFAQAITHWERVKTLVAADPEAVASLQTQIDNARARAGMPADAAPAAVGAGTDDSDTPLAAGPRLTVQVDIAPALKAQVGASDTLFVYARAPEGSRMPLAIQRLAAGALPVTVVLDDSTSMMPQMTLSSLPQVVVGARISRSGQAIPQPGDLEALSPPVATTDDTPIQLTIDRVVE